MKLNFKHQSTKVRRSDVELRQSSVDVSVESRCDSTVDILRRFVEWLISLF